MFGLESDAKVQTRVICLVIWCLKHQVDFYKFMRWTLLVELG